MAKKQSFVIKLPKAYTPTVRTAIATEIMDYIRERSSDGKDKDNNPFPKYSKAYKGYKALITGSASPVNLSLSGDMLAALDLIKNSAGQIEIGYKRSSEFAGQAEGNVTGSYGQPSPNPKKARDFLGISKSDLQTILRKYPVENIDKATTRAERVISISEASGEPNVEADIEEE